LAQTSPLHVVLYEKGSAQFDEELESQEKHNTACDEGINKLSITSISSIVTIFFVFSIHITITHIEEIITFDFDQCSSFRPLT